MSSFITKEFLLRRQELCRPETIIQPVAQVNYYLERGGGVVGTDPCGMNFSKGILASLFKIARSGYHKY